MLPQIYNQSLYSKKSIHKAILNGAKSLMFYKQNERLVPLGLEPQCHKMYITVADTYTAASSAATGSGRVKGHGARLSSAAATSECSTGWEVIVGETSIICLDRSTVLYIVGN